MLSYLVLCALCLLGVTNSTLTYTVRVTSGTSHSTCDTGFFEGSSDPVWGAKIYSQDSYLLMRGSGYSCPDRSPPQTIYTEERECDSQRSRFRLCLLAGDDDESSAGCSFSGTSVQASELGCDIEDCSKYSDIMDECFLADCSYTETISDHNIADGSNRAHTSGVVWEITRTGNCITDAPTRFPTEFPTESPTGYPTAFPTLSPSTSPTAGPTQSPIIPVPTFSPTLFPTNNPTTPAPTTNPTRSPTRFPTEVPTTSPTISPITPEPTQNPTYAPTYFPTRSPIAFNETSSPTTLEPTTSPTKNPTTTAPTDSPTTSAPTFSCATELEQCGGEDWEGTTCCVDGYGCSVVSNLLSVCTAANSQVAVDEDGDDVNLVVIIAVALSVVIGCIVAGAFMTWKVRERKKKKVAKKAAALFEKEVVPVKGIKDSSSEALDADAEGEEFPFGADWKKVDYL